VADFDVLAEHDEYYLVRVTFLGNSFDQWIVSPSIGSALEVQIQLYAEEYEAAWVALGLEPE
jgi:hypothetical protein